MWRALLIAGRSRGQYESTAPGAIHSTCECGELAEIPPLTPQGQT